MRIPFTNVKHALRPLLFLAQPLQSAPFCAPCHSFEVADLVRLLNPCCIAPCRAAVVPGAIVATAPAVGTLGEEEMGGLLSAWLGRCVRPSPVHLTKFPTFFSSIGKEGRVSALRVFVCWNHT